METHPYQSSGPTQPGVENTQQEPIKEMSEQQEFYT